MRYEKKQLGIGAWLKKGEDIKDGDIVVIANEGQQVPSQFGEQDVFLIKTASGKEGNMSLNGTSLNNMIDAFGEESRNWVGKKVKVWAILSNVKGKMIKVYYVSHPDAIVNEAGDFVLQGKTKNDDIPVVNAEPDIEYQEMFGK